MVPFPFIHKQATVILKLGCLLPVHCVPLLDEFLPNHVTYVFGIMCMCVKMVGYVHLHAGAYRSQRSQLSWSQSYRLL